MPGSLLSSDLSTSQPWWDSGVVKSFAGSPDWVLALFLKFFTMYCARSPRCTFGGRELPRTDHWSATLHGDTSALAHTCPFSQSCSTLCRHDQEAQTQPRASEEPGCCQKSRCFCCGHLLLPPAQPTLGCPPFCLVSLLQPAFETSSSLAPPGSVVSCSNDRAHGSYLRSLVLDLCVSRLPT